MLAEALEDGGVRTAALAVGVVAVQGNDIEGTKTQIPESEDVFGVPVRERTAIILSTKTAEIPVAGGGGLTVGCGGVDESSSFFSKES